MLPSSGIIFRNLAESGKKMIILIKYLENSIINWEAARFLYVLAFLELRQNDDMRNKAGLPPLPPTDRSQFRAQCFRESSTRISAALAKATVMRITGTPSLPAPTFLSHINLARNCPGPADALPRRAPLRRGPGTATSLYTIYPHPLSLRSLPFSVDLESAPLASTSSC